MTYPETSPSCLVCGAQHTACGHGGDVTPVDIPTVETRMPSELRLYDVVVNGYATRMRLDDTDAARLNGSLVDEARDADADPIESIESDEIESAAIADEPKRKARSKVPNRARTADDTK